MRKLAIAMDMGQDVAASMIVRAVNRVLRDLHVQMEQVVRLAVCGSPIQLSLFQAMEIRDIAHAGSAKLESLGVHPPERREVRGAADFAGLALPAFCDVLIPPAISHEVRADALAMMMQTGMLERDETSLATDYGTNAEMALHHEGRANAGSAAVGPALEGQQISRGMLAAPGAICDLVLKRYGLPGLPEPGVLPRVVRRVERDIEDLGRFGLTTIVEIGQTTTMAIEGCIVRVMDLTLHGRRSSLHRALGLHVETCAGTLEALTQACPRRHSSVPPIVVAG